MYDLIKKVVSMTKAPRAYKYALYLREYDNMVELLGLVDDPNQDMKEYVGREMLFPKRWVTLDVLDANMAMKG